VVANLGQSFNRASSIMSLFSMKASRRAPGPVSLVVAYAPSQGSSSRSLHPPSPKVSASQGVHPCAGADVSAAVGSSLGSGLTTTVADVAVGPALAMTVVGVALCREPKERIAPARTSVVIVPTTIHTRVRRGPGWPGGSNSVMDQSLVFAVTGRSQGDASTQLALSHDRRSAADD